MTIGRNDERASIDVTGLTYLGRIVGSIVAPTSLFTGLLYYFGWNNAYWFFDEFGVHSTVLGLSTADYLQRSVDSLFVPLTVGALGGLAALWAHGMLRARFSPGGRVLRYLVLAMVVMGLVLTMAGFISVFTRTWLSDHLVVAPLCLAGGVLLMAYANRLRHPRPDERLETSAIVEWAIVFVLVAIALFWAAGDYSAAVGTGRARRYVRNLPTFPGVILYSDRSLSLTMPGVRETRCHDAQAAYRFRYDGLNLVQRSGDQYLLLPKTWTQSQGRAILLPRSGTVRLEFTRWGGPEATC